MTTLVITNTFAANTLIRASEVNQNFTDVRAVINGLIDGASNISSIITANKVSGAALYLLGNIPSGAGIVPSANLDRFNPIWRASSTVVTEGAGTMTALSFTGGNTISITGDAALSVFGIAICNLENDDITGAMALRINKDGAALGSTIRSDQHATASERTTVVAVLLDVRPTAAAHTYGADFQRVTAGTATARERDLIVFSIPDPA